MQVPTRPIHVVESDSVQLREDLSYKEELIQILDRRQKQLCRKMVPLVKVLWVHHEVLGANCEPEQEMQSKYPHMFN